MIKKETEQALTEVSSDSPDHPFFEALQRTASNLYTYTVNTELNGDFTAAEQALKTFSPEKYGNDNFHHTFLEINDMTQ